MRNEYYDALNMYPPQHDLEKDPFELNNLWEEPAAAALRAELTQRSFDPIVAVQ